MNESTLLQLKIIVERAVRPVLASSGRKRKMREELLAHVSDVFEEEAAKLGNDRAALEQTALRFGNPAEVTSQLQESVPASNAMQRFLQGQPGEPMSRTTLRLAWVSGLFALATVVFLVGVAALAVGWVSAWPRETLLIALSGVLAVPVYLSGLAFLADWMEKALYDPAGHSWLKIGLVAAGSWLFLLLWFATFTWGACFVALNAVLLAGWLAVVAPAFVYELARSSHARRSYFEEWDHLNIA